MSRALLILFLITVSVQSHALELNEVHLFTDKKGKQITATLLEVTADQRTVKIRREDGIEFSPEIVLFSLDDQQYIKDWMELKKAASANGPVASDFHLAIEIDQEEASTDKHSSGSLTLESTPHFFEINVSNTSREVLEGAALEYIVIWEEEVSIYEDEDEGEWTYRNSRKDEGERLLRQQRRLPLDAIAFNRDVSVKTDEVVIDRVASSDGDLVREDLFLGVLVRVLGANGQILAESSEGESELAEYTWEKTLTIASVDPPEE